MATKKRSVTKQKQTLVNKIWDEILFWGHIVIIIAFILCGLIVPLQVLVFLLIAWNIHLMILGRCIITIIQDKFLTEAELEDAPLEQPFMDRAYFRFTGKNLSDRAFDTLLTLIPTLALLVAVIADILGIVLLKI